MVAVHVEDQALYALPVALETGITFPVLLDCDGRFLREWSRVGEDVPAFPLGYLLARDGSIAAIFTQSEPPIGELKAAISALLTD